MRRVAVLPLLMLALAGCGGNSPAEDAYLDVIRDRSSLIDIDEGDALDRGNTICDTITGIKPADRELAASLLLNQGFAYYELAAATDSLCPEADVNL